MILSNVAEVRTGLVTARKKTTEKDENNLKYKMLNLKCIMPKGYIDFNSVEDLETTEPLKKEYFTQINDILVRLSSPYTAIMITNKNECGYVIPSHFAIIRVNTDIVVPEYIFWAVKRDDTRQKVLQNISGNTAFGTISSGFFSNLKVRDLPIEKQRIVGQVMMLADKEQELLHRLADTKALYNKVMVKKIYNEIKRGI